ncbi:DEAD/DEAH box helicase [Lachnoclostridium pacaense]|uniref:DEAD/DEAH box helicase n=1 Tax=Enterocloster hominis (ex Hitch et al. 2024) TaxID=1917870 RepID=UPI001D0F52D0|nr:DEAD/DEAH box helicase [Lachnoclostridium pacaense]MCC2819640.1 DEAD/DEAH box helicase [Lachnoclostridium pacaense]
MPTDTLTLFSQPTAQWFKDTLGRPTKVQEDTWPAIASGHPVLVSAPTGTGKTLSAFLVFIDRLYAMAEEGTLKEELYLIYVSPLKSLAGDIQENLNRPLEGIRQEMERRVGAARQTGYAGLAGDVHPAGKIHPAGDVHPAGTTSLDIQVGIRTGDTPQKDRQMMVKHPPHILIITPESLYLMLTSMTGQKVLRTARAVIIDELHALIDTKRGAHLMLSIARLDCLCGRPLQRIGLSATIEPLELAAAYLSPEPAVICAPAMEKQIRIEILGTTPAQGRRKDPVWEELGQAVYRQCLSCRSVIAFSEGRRYAEKLAYYVNLLGGDGFARVHHGSLSKEQRAEVEQDLRDGRLRLLCATSSMELGIDVGELDLVIQVGCPRTVSSTMQRLGRAGHGPGRVSVMYMYPRTASESVYCGMTAQVARQGGVEHTKPPRMCLDVLAQHLVSMANGEGYCVEDVMAVLERSYPFRDVTGEDIKAVLSMLAGDYEHRRDIPVRPRVLYDRIHGRVEGDAYSRMLATAAGGTIPDKGLYTAKTEDGVKLGELDEEFVYESQLGDKFMLGSFGWKITGIDKDTVYVSQAPAEGARLPFWKGEIRGRTLKTSREFGKILAGLEAAHEQGRLREELSALGMDEAAVINASGFLERQIQSTGGLPDNKTIVVEHFTDHTGCHQVMLHALLGRRVNGPLSLLLQHMVRNICGFDIGCVDEEDGFLLYPYGSGVMPEGLLYRLEPDQVRETLEAMLPLTPLFGMAFRYNAARALMMGMKQGGRQPLWMQRLKSTEMLDSLMNEKDHPLIRETKRECLEDQWDIDGVIQILHEIRAGLIHVREVCTDVPSPMSLPLQWQVEAAEMYEYAPATPGIRQAVYDELKYLEGIRPAPEALEKQQERTRLPQDEAQLHSLLMTEGDLEAGELDVPVEWLASLAAQGRALYIEPGLWIAAEQEEEYEKAFSMDGLEEAAAIVRRLLRYRKGHTPGQIGERYFLPEEKVGVILEMLCSRGEIVEADGIYYHRKLYDRARQSTLKNLRRETATQPGAHYAALLAGRAKPYTLADEQLKKTLELYCGRMFPVRFWENVLLPRRVRNYSEGMLDRLLAEGDYYWKMSPDGALCFCRYEDIDWDAPLPDMEGILGGEELQIYRELKRRGACFLKFLADIPKEKSAQELLLGLAEKGLVCADSFVPVRQWQNREKVKKATARQRVSARVMALSAGRWDIVRPLKPKKMEEWLELIFQEQPVMCRETFRRAAAGLAGSPYLSGFSQAGAARSDAGEAAGAARSDMNYQNAMELLRIWEYTGQVRRGYFVEGMSGAQFIRKEEYEGVTAALKAPEDGIIWLNAADSAQIWGKILVQPGERDFLNVPGTAVALHCGRVTAVLERQGRVLRVFESQGLEQTLQVFVNDFKGKRLFPELKRLIVREYPEGTGETLKRAGFSREMNDYVLYR